MIVNGVSNGIWPEIAPMHYTNSPPISSLIQAIGGVPSVKMRLLYYCSWSLLTYWV